ncbi:MAG: Nif3-like dinuclear metal center hexameric protein [Bacteroidota bacterium]
MRVQEIQELIETWAPRETAWEGDNVGLQVGSRDQKVQRILVALEITPQVLSEAKRKKVDFIITHHPLLFHPLRSVTDATGSGRLVQEIVRNGIAVYSAHTNLDSARDGVSFVLAERLGLSEIDFLQRSSSGMKKIVVFVPPDHLEAVAEAMSSAGAGVIGDYDKCSFRMNGTGTFQPRAGASPFVGTVGSFQNVREVRLEMLVPSWRFQDVIRKMIEAHPYEEVAYDVYPLENQSRDSGSGAVGTLKQAMSFRQFLGRIKSSLEIRSLRFSGNLASKVRRVAVCGGAGGSLLPTAIREGTDVFVTADVKYHTFQDARDKIAIVDAGHYETERPVLEAVVNRLRKAIKEKGEKVEVALTSVVTSPVFYA